MSENQNLADLCADFLSGGPKTIDRKECPVCASPRRFQFARQDRYGLPTHAYLCRSCGFIYLSPILANEEIGPFYADWYRKFASAYRGTELTPEAVEKDQSEYAEALWDTVSCHVPQWSADGSPIVLYDVGGGTGVVSAYFREKIPGAQVTVVDPGAPELDRAGKRGLGTLCATAEEWNPAQESADVILICRTMDHIVDPSRVLRTASRALKEDGGVLVVDFTDWPLVAKSEGVQNAMHIDHPSNWDIDLAYELLWCTGLPDIESYALQGHSGMGFVCRRMHPGEGPPSLRSLQGTGISARLQGLIRDLTAKER